MGLSAALKNTATRAQHGGFAGRSALSQRLARPTTPLGTENDCPAVGFRRNSRQTACDLGNVWFNLLDLPVAPLSFYASLTIGLTALAGLLFALLLPTIIVAAGIERRLQRRIGRLDLKASATGKHRLIALQTLPNLRDGTGETLGKQDDHPQPRCGP